MAETLAIVDYPNGNAVSETGNNNVLLDTTAVWANSALVNTAVSKTVALPATLPDMVIIGIVNPSAVTAINVDVYNVDGADDLRIAQFQIPVSSKVDSPPIYAFPRRSSGKIILSNATVLGVADGFTAKVKVLSV